MHATVRHLLTLLFMFVALPALAQERATLGVGHLYVNDAFGDGADRWATSGYTVSVLRGPAGLSGLPSDFGTMMEYRFSHRVLAPANLTAPAAGDRPYAGLGSIGAYSHFAARGFDVSFGAEAMFSGPMTGAARGQTALHNLLGIAAPSAAVRAGQIPNRAYPVLAGEIARPVALGSGAVLRPFASARAGDEAFLRAGVDLLIGSNFTSGVLLRDATTGILYQGLEQAPENGLSFLLGADTARVFSSAWLPGATLTPLRSRARAGVQYQADHLGVFYGVSWLSREFAAQPSGQVVGALEIQLRF